MTTLSIIFPLLTDLEKLEYGDCIASLFLCTKDELDQTIVQQINDEYDAGAIMKENGKNEFFIEIKTEAQYQVILNELTLQRDCIAYESNYSPYDSKADSDKRIFALTDIIARLGLYRLFDEPVNALYDGLGTIIRRY